MRHNLILALACSVLLCGVFAIAQTQKQATPGKSAMGTSIETHGPFGLVLPYPEASNIYQVPAFDTQGGARQLVQVEIVVGLAGGSEWRFRAHGSDAEAGRFAGEPWSMVMVEATDSGGFFDAAPVWDPMGHVVSPYIGIDGETEWFDAQYESTETQTVSGEIGMWLDPSGTVDLVVHEAGANTGHGSGNGGLSVGETWRDGHFTINYIWIEGNGSAAPAPQPALRRPRDFAAEFCDAVDRKIGNGVVMAPNTSITFGGE